MQFHFHANQSQFHKNGLALGLALKQRHKRTRKCLLHDCVLVQGTLIVNLTTTDNSCIMGIREFNAGGNPVIDR